MAAQDPTAAEPELWQSLDQWMDSPKFAALMKDEFPEDAAEWLDPVSRRQFLTVMGASVALAGAGCNPSVRPASQRKVVPYVKQPTELLPNVPLYFATAVAQAGGVGLGLLVRSNEGRPTKIEGNPNHPGSLGGTNVYAQGAVLGLYDPDRSKEVFRPTQNAAGTMDQAIAAIRDELVKESAKPLTRRGEGVRILMEPLTSPTLAAQVDEFLKRYPLAKVVQYEAAGRDNPRRAAAAAFGRPVAPAYHLDKARVVLSLDNDFLSAAGPGEIRYARDFISKRKVREGAAALAAGDGVEVSKMNRLYVVEAMLTPTGASADHRLPVKPTQVEAVARALAAQLGVAGVPAAGDLPDLAKQWVKPLADDLLANRGAAAVLVGDGQPPAVHLLAHAINEKIGAVGGTVTFTEPVEFRPPADTAADFRALVGEMKAGTVGLLMLLGGNPAYDAPADLEFAKALGDMKGVKVHHGLYVDETAVRCQWHLNAAHFLEVWGDVRGFDGTVSVQQPLIAPLYHGRSCIELFALLLELGEGDALEVVKGTWKKHHDDTVKSAGFEDWWQQAVRDGVVPGTALKPAEPAVGAVKLDALTDKAFATPAAKPGLELQYRPDPTVYDGRFANNGWLQELPKPVTKLTWDNAAIVSPGTAATLGCSISFGWTGGEHGRSEADVVELTLDGRKLRAAVFVLPGHADDCVTFHLGYGRERGGRVATGVAGTTPGFNAYALRTGAAPWVAGGLEVSKPVAKYVLACTQGQYAMEGRKPARMATVEQFRKDEDFAQVPAASAGEYKDVRALTPGTPEDFQRLGLDHPHKHERHGHDHDHGSPGTGETEHPGEHDARTIPLTMYPQNPFRVAGEDTSKTYRRWGMSIDLTACTGCTTCVAACVAENNIPVVGKDQVTRGRAMHWIRIDRYFSIPGEKPGDDHLGGKETAQNFLRGNSERQNRVKQSAAIVTHFQPLLCQQCEKAPCEIVCPVGATVHSADGLNDMVYNRCVGTRYCSNNCPYKVRRFNFLQYTDYTTASLKLLNNPEVTVRQRGVMEKCTYCVQRIRNAEIEAEREWQTRPADAHGRPRIRDGEVVTACQAACPTGAIVFGDLNDPASAVLRAKAEPQTYGLLAELNTMPRTSYLAAIRNPNPAMPKGA